MLNGKKKCHRVKMNIFRSAATLLLLPACLLNSNAQDERNSVPSIPGARESKGADQDREDGRFTSELGIWAAGSVFVRSTRTDRSDDARMYILGLTFTRAIAVRRSFALSYTADVVPLVLLSHPRAKEDQPQGAPGSGALKRATVHGTGLAPVGFKLNFRPRRRTQPFLDFKVGFVFFDEKIPTDRGTRFNFAALSGGGVQVLTGLRTSVIFGSRFHHISNGGRGLTNPGFNTVMLYTAFSIRR